MNVPNVLTVLRLLLIGVFVYLFQLDYYVAAVCIFILAAVTDLLDGYIARKYDLVTNFGKLMDPLADKLMLIAALVCLASKGIIPIIILVFVIVKELIMVIGGAFLYKKNVVVYAKTFGKAATFCFNAAVVLTFLKTYIGWINVIHLHLIVFSIAIVLAIIAFCQYVNSFWKQRKNIN